MTKLRNTWAWGILMIFWGVLSVLLDAVAILLAAPFLGGKRAFFLIGPLWARQLFWIGGVKLEVVGWDDLPEDIRSGRQPVIFMSTHESNLDPPVLISAIPVPAVYISKKELKWVPLVGWAAGVGGTIFIDRGRREKAIHSIREAAAQIRGGKTVVIFPEGTRTRTGRLGAFKKGGFAMAMEAGVPIVPLATVGGFRTLPPGSMRLRPGRYTIVVGSPVDPKAFPDRDALLAEVQTHIERLVETAKAGA
ncbi:MAG TPA: lysophospholipid acyltransferase family protein [Holophaga sp.]|nr:lysophospholipid acyltransferase family protein [Holophaga sp.]